MTWDEIDWSVLDRLRARFLSETPASEPYWQSPDDLANYDFTYGERIGWKWDQVLRELSIRGWSPTGRTVLDWGCGSGVASRRVIAHFGASAFESLTVWDHSPLACDFAAQAAQAAFSTLRVMQATPGYLDSGSRIGLLIISHVLNELPTGARDTLRLLALRADAILWVEPGTHDISRQLGGFREQLRGGGFRVVAPCTHENECPMFAIGRERDWCHFFAPPPSEIFADSNWVKFGQRAGIDLRGLPYAFLALDRNHAAAVSPVSDRRMVAAATLDPNAESAPALPAAAVTPPTTGTEDLSRVVGRVEHFKPYARFLNCDATGLTDLEVPKRANPALYKELERTKAPLVYRWQRDGAKVVGGQRVGIETTD
ncbi:MAG TPA: small ribosomal subunit Rsm22 family protein [Opitutaceae bacterium]|nr:small ribosomal subunit Rsm22 family protein [Opitutaceae bacterium]